MSKRSSSQKHAFFEFVTETFFQVQETLAFRSFFGVVFYQFSSLQLKNNLMT